MSGLVDTLKQITTVIYPDMQNIQSQSAISAQNAAVSAQNAATLAAGIASASADIATAKAAGDNIKNVIYPDIQSKLIEATQKIAETEEMIRVTEASLLSIVGADLDISTFLAAAERDVEEIASAKATVDRLIGELSALTGGIIGGSGGGVGGDCDEGVIYTYPKGQGAMNKFKPEAHEHCDLIGRAEFEQKLTEMLVTIKGLIADETVKSNAKIRFVHNDLTTKLFFCSSGGGSCTCSSGDNQTALYLDRSLEMKFLYSFLRVPPHILVAPLDRTLEIFFERSA